MQSGNPSGHDHSQPDTGADLPASPLDMAMARLPLKSLLTILMAALTAGCSSHGIFVKRQSELNCPTDVRKTVPWCVGEDAIFQCPCGPAEAFYGHRPTCWRTWPAPAAVWRDSYCPTEVSIESGIQNPFRDGDLVPLPQAEPALPQGPLELETPTEVIPPAASRPERLYKSNTFGAATFVAPPNRSRAPLVTPSGASAPQFADGPRRMAAPSQAGAPPGPVETFAPLATRADYDARPPGEGVTTLDIVEATAVYRPSAGEPQSMMKASYSRPSIANPVPVSAAPAQAAGWGFVR
jgi:hypothetical protein